MFDGTNYVAIADLRRREGLTGPEFGPVYLAQGNGPNSPLTPSPGGWFKVCAKWKSKFVDTGWDDYASNAGQQTTPAAWALAEIRQSPSLLCPSPDPAACTTLVWAGSLPEDGCVRFNPATSSNYVIKVYTNVVVPAPDPAVPPLLTSKIKYYDATLTDRGVQAVVRSFATPATTSPSVAAVTLPYHLTTNAAAAASRLFALSDLPNGKYDLLVNLGCPSQNGLDQYDSCAGDGFLYLGPANPALNLGPDVSWKNVIGHELGHLVQRHLDSRPPANLSPCPGCGWDDPAEDPICWCQHVTAANQKHCLQSSERVSAANVEGFGHFFAAKLWNDPVGTDCWFNYYKESFKDDGTVDTYLPRKIDCRSATRWRNTRCTFRPERGTELDWLQFLWNLNTVGPHKITLSEIGAIHRKACGGSCAALQGEFTWSLLHQGASDHYDNPNDPQFLYFEQTGAVFGVDETP